MSTVNLLTPQALCEPASVPSSTGEPQTDHKEPTAPRRRGRPPRAKIDLSTIPDTPSAIPRERINGEIPIERILYYAMQGYPPQDIADIFGCGRQNIDNRLKPYREDLQSLVLFEKNKANVFDAITKKIAFGLDDECIKKATLKDKAVAIGILEDKSRKIKGLDSIRNNVNILALTIKAAHGIGQVAQGLGSEYSAKKLTCGEVVQVVENTENSDLT